MTVEQGIDPRRFALLAFGGAGGLHACEMADELEISTVLVPRASGVFSALGLAAAERREDSARSVIAPLTAPIDAPEGELAFELRYAGQAHELSVRGVPAEPGALRTAFEALHAERYGYTDPEAEVELVTIRSTRREPGPEVALRGGGARIEERERSVVLAGERGVVRIIRGEPGPGAEVDGPAVVELPEATVVIPPGWHGAWDEDRTLRLERSA